MGSQGGLPTYYNSAKDVSVSGVAGTAEGMRSRLWRLTFVLGTLIYGSHSIFINLCQVDGQLPFSTASVVLMTETAKLLISAAIFLVNHRRNKDAFVAPRVQQAWPFAVPAIIYAVNNNLAYTIQLHMDPASFQILSNLKIATTALLYRLIMKKKIGSVQTFALFLLILAGICNSLGGFVNEKKETTHTESGMLEGELNAGTLHVTFVGLILITIYCFNSGMAGVYTEYILKKSVELPLSLQNILLYVFGVGLNGGSYFVSALLSEHDGAGTHEVNETHLFTGYTGLTWLMVLTQAFNGLIMSVIFKHSNNIARLFLVSASMVVTTLASVALFGLHLNAFFCFAFILVLVALYLYHNK